MVVLTNAASLEFKNYTPADFAEINCAEIQDLSSSKGAKVQATLRGEEITVTGTGASIMNRDIDVTEFRRILCLELANPGKGNVLRAVKALEQREDVYCVSPNYVIQPTAIIPPEGATYTWAAGKIELDDAWDIETGSNTVLVGVVDSGIDITHPALANRVNTSLSRDFVGDSYTALEDIYGHGTHVAGIIGGQGTNSFGIRGVCQNVTLVSLRSMDIAGTAEEYKVVAAINYAETQGIPLLNLSLSATVGSTINIRQAIDNYSGLVICAAGNDGLSLDSEGLAYPAMLDNANIVSVASSTQDDSKSPNSNYGKVRVDLFAPGASIASCYPLAKCASSNCSFFGHIGYGYHFMSGTSMAAPHVTGVAALILSAHPDTSMDALKSALLDSVDPVAAFENLCVTGGRLNAYNALSSPALHTDFLYLRSNASQHWAHCIDCGYRSLEPHIMHPTLDLCLLCD